ncbi:MAG: transcription initiation factor IIB [Promethearchaeota archaeon]
MLEQKIVSNISQAPNASNIDACPECGSENLIKDTHRGELICPECGTVVEEQSFDFSQEKRAFTAEEIENRRHNGSPISALSDISWTTIIKTSDKNTSAQLKRAVKWQTRLTWEKKNFLIAVNEIKRICTNLGLPRVVAETAATLYKKVQKKNILRGRSINGFVGACVYCACRINKIPRSVVEIYEQMQYTTDRDIRLCYRVLVNELGIKVPKLNPVQLLPRYASILEVSSTVSARAEKILKIFIMKLKTAGKDPKGYIAASLYLACKEVGEHRAQKHVASACSITEVTLRSRIKEFNAALERM